MQTPPLIDVERVFQGITHLQWAENTARAIAHAKGFQSRGQEEQELVSVAHLILCRRARTFREDMVPAGGNADGQFRGFCHTSIKWECLKEAARIRGGGTFHCPSKEEAKSVRVQALPTMTNELGEDEVSVEDRREVVEPDEELDEFPASIEKPPAAWMGCGRCGNRAKLRPHEPRECVRCGAALEVVRVAA